MRISPGLSIVQKFVISSFLALALGGLVLGIHLDDEIERQAIRQAAGETAAFVDRVLRLQLRLVPSESITAEHVDRLRLFLKGRPLGEEVPLIKVWAPDGTILYASDSRLIGRRYPIRGGLGQALKGQTSSRLSSLQKSENALERETFRSLLEVYVPLRSDSGRIVGAFEAYQTTEKLAADLTHFRTELWSDIFLILLLLTGLMYLLFRRDVARPLKLLTQAVQRLERGDFPEAPPYEGKNELGRLSTAFAHMASALRAREEELYRNNAQLEENRKLLDRQLSERVRELSAVDDLTASIFASQDASKIPQVAVELLGKALGARSGAAFLLDGDLQLAGSCHLTEPHSRRLQDPAGLPEEKLAAKAIARQTVLAAGDVEAEEDFADFRESAKREGFRALTCVPVTSKGRPLGAIFHYFEEPKVWRENVLRFAAVIGNEVGLALENAKLFGEIEYRNRELSAVNALSATVTSSLDLEQILWSVLDNVLHVLEADAGAIYLLDKGRDRLRMATGRGFADEVAEELKLVKIGEGIAGEVASLREPRAGLLADNAGGSSGLYRAGFRSYAGFPLVSRGALLGVLQVLIRDERVVPEEQTQLLQALAAQAAVAIQNALLYGELEESYKEQHRIAGVLQKSMLPAELPEVPGAELGAYYASATTGATVGGDFYDVFALRDGRMAIAIGDVCGKGVEAAAATAMVKSLIRGMAAEDPSPSSLLARLNNAVEGQLKDGSFITLLYGVYAWERGEFAYASAGHIPPFVLTDGETHDYQAGIPLGVIRRRKYSEFTLRLQPGDVMVLVTDGLIEARREGELFGAERCREILEKHSGRSAQPLAELLYKKCLEYAKQLQDDVAILVIKRETEKNGL